MRAFGPCAAMLAMLAASTSAQSATVTYHGKTNDPGLECVCYYNGIYNIAIRRDSRTSTSHGQRGTAFLFVSPTYSGLLTHVVQIDQPIFLWSIYDPTGVSAGFTGWSPVKWYGAFTFYAQGFFWGRGIYWTRVAKIVTS